MVLWKVGPALSGIRWSKRALLHGKPCPMIKAKEDQARKKERDQAGEKRRKRSYSQV